MDDINQLYNAIRQELEKPKPSPKIIVSYLLSVPAENFDAEFYTLVANVFQLDPKFFMESLYPLFRKTGGKLYGDQKIKEMEKYILEKFCLPKGEEILFERDGSIQQLISKSYKLEVLDGTIYVTARRIIAQGRLWTKRMSSRGPLALALIPLAIAAGGDVPGGRGSWDIKPKNAKEALIDTSVGQELPCYGYTFPIENIFDLRKETKKIITYKIIHGKWNPNIFRYKISFSSFKTREKIDKFFEILSKKERGRKLEGKKIYFKGRLETIEKVHAERLIKALGGRITGAVVGSGGVAKDLSYLVTNSTKTKAKYVKAQERGTKIITEQEFLDLIVG